MPNYALLCPYYAQLCPIMPNYARPWKIVAEKDRRPDSRDGSRTAPGWFQNRLGCRMVSGWFQDRLRPEELGTELQLLRRQTLAHQHPLRGTSLHACGGNLLALLVALLKTVLHGVQGLPSQKAWRRKCSDNHDSPLFSLKYAAGSFLKHRSRNWGPITNVAILKF